LSAPIHFVLLGAAMGAALSFAFVAVGAALSEATTPATRGLAMGGYSTAIYLGVGLASVGLGPVIASFGYTAGFTVAGAAGGAGTLVVGALWRREEPGAEVR
jgi:predicted MFS family arabinose efflux permease